MAKQQMVAQSDFVKLNQFNELHIDGRKVTVAKYPNHDPSTKGLYANDRGFSYDSQSWKSTTTIPTTFPNYHFTLGGRTSLFNPPRSFGADMVFFMVLR